MRYVIVITLLLLFTPLAPAQTTWYVPDNFPTIQGALSSPSVMDGDTVIVRPGIYFENIDFPLKAVTLKSEKGPEVTVIDGGQITTVMQIIQGNGPDTVLDGFTIQNGFDSTAGWPGGILCADSSPLVINNIIKDNSSSYNGGGIYCQNSSMTIANNVIYKNSAFRGGGICAFASDVLIENNLIFENAAELGGAGIALYIESTPIVRNNRIMYNQGIGGTGGSGIRCAFSFPKIMNNFIYGNEKHAVSFNWSEEPLYFTNNTLTGNGGGGIQVLGAKKVKVSNSIIWGNDFAGYPEISDPAGNMLVTYCNVKGGWPGDGNIETDPLFASTGQSDFHLTSGSPCRDAGTATPKGGLPETDFEGDLRDAHAAPDMGADEFYTHLYYFGNPSPGWGIFVKLVGIPGSSPVGLWFGPKALDVPIQTSYGEWWSDWWLDTPYYQVYPLAPIPPGGIEILNVTLPSGVPGPYNIYMQGFIGDSLTNLSVLEVK